MVIMELRVPIAGEDQPKNTQEGRGSRWEQMRMDTAFREEAFKRILRGGRGRTQREAENPRGHRREQGAASTHTPDRRSGSGSFPSKTSWGVAAARRVLEIVYQFIISFWCRDPTQVRSLYGCLEVRNSPPFWESKS